MSVWNDCALKQYVLFYWTLREHQQNPCNVITFSFMCDLRVVTAQMRPKTANLD